jgi:ferritin-like metal-binding protein YciE
MEKEVTTSQPSQSSPGGEPAFRDSKLQALLLDELNDIYGSEKHQLVILPMLKRAASSLKLCSVLARHLDSTREQLTRLEEVFSQLGKTADERISESILGIARECETVIGETEPGTATRDAGLIMSVQKLEHYEIGSYGSLAQLARTLEYDDIADLLETTLMEEKDVDDLLTSLAENYINIEASREAAT